MPSGPKILLLKYSSSEVSEILSIMNPNISIESE